MVKYYYQGGGTLKKYIYTGILLGTIVLAGCSANEDSKEQVMEDTTNEQTVEVEILPDNDKEEVSVTPLVLTQEQKEEYYKQYVEIIEKINAEGGINHLEVVPINEFKPEDWVDPETFIQLAIERANAEFTSPR